MKINQEKVKERLAHVPDRKRSHIYDATIVLEFLSETFMPTKFFLPQNFSPAPGIKLGEKSMRKISEEKNMTIGTLYDLYKLFREQKDYTARVESSYIFGIIIRNLRYYRNGWEFIFWRVGSAQIWHVGPLLLRTNVPVDVRTKFASQKEQKSVEQITVEADPITHPEEDPVIGVDFGGPEGDHSAVVHGKHKAGGTVEISKIENFNSGATKPPAGNRFVEVTADRFKEVNFEVTVEVSPPADEGY